MNRNADFCYECKKNTSPGVGSIPSIWIGDTIESKAFIRYCLECWNMKGGEELLIPFSKRAYSWHQKQRMKISTRVNCFSCGNEDKIFLRDMAEDKNYNFCISCFERLFK